MARLLTRRERPRRDDDHGELFTAAARDRFHPATLHQELHHVTSPAVHDEVLLRFRASSAVDHERGGVAAQMQHHGVGVGPANESFGTRVEQLFQDFRQLCAAIIVIRRMRTGRSTKIHVVITNATRFRHCVAVPHWRSDAP